MVRQTFPVPLNWRKEFEKAKSEGLGNGSPAHKNSSVDRPAYTAAGQAARQAIEQLEKKYVKMPTTNSGEPKFASRSDGVEAGIVSGGFVPPTLD